MTTTNPVIQVQGLRKTYSVWYRGEKKPALKGIDFDVAKGEIFGFLGPNGAGKSTTIKLLLGLIRPDAGAIRILGGRPGEVKVKRRIGYMPERTMLPLYLTLREMVKLYGNLSGLKGKALNLATDATIDRVGLAAESKHQLDTFSKGMLQRASLAQALVADPELLLLDEPATGLDPLGRHQFRELMTELRSRGRTIFLNSHELEVVELICDRFAILDQGKIIAVEPVSVLRASNRFVLTLTSPPDSPEILAGKLSGKVAWDAVRHSLVMECRDLAEANRILDQVRHEGLEIASFNPDYVSLEKFFLRYLSTTQQL